ncbi:MAG: hypothetical protein AAB757_02520 [Patescibacteria group bacterium]
MNIKLKNVSDMRKHCRNGNTTMATKRKAAKKKVAKRKPAKKTAKKRKR